jgi:hypothetical protein
MNEHVEHGSGVGETGLKMMGSTMKHLLSMTHDSQQRKGRLNTHAVIPSSFQAQFQVVGNARFATTAKISQNKSISRQQIDQGQKILVGVIHWQPTPAHDLSHVVENPTQLHANRPTPLVLNSWYQSALPNVLAQ